MNSSAKISNLDENDDVLKFTLSGVNVSYANSIRRILLSNIPTLKKLFFFTSTLSGNRW